MKLLIAVLIFSCFLLTATTINAQYTKLEALHNKAISLRQQGKYDEAIAIVKQVLDIVEKNFDPDHPYVATGLNNLAALYYSLGQYEKAESLYQRSLAIAKKTLAGR